MSAPASMPLRRQSGLSLIELMISMTVGLVILGALSAAYLGSRAAYRTNEDLARMQESGRFALDLLGQDLRLAGFVGCRSRTIAPDRVLMVARPPVGSNIAGVPYRGAADAVIGFENGGGWTNPGTVARVAGDVITVRRGAAGVEAAADVDIPNARVTIRDNAPSFKKGDYVALSTCSHVAFFRITNDPAQGYSSKGVVLEHGINLTGTGFNPATDGNGQPGVAESNWLKGIGSLDLGARPVAYRFAEISYFIGNNPGGRRALYRVSAGAAAEELAEGVEDMDVLYGIDDNGDLNADRYVRADQILLPADWARVVSARISLLVASQDVAAGTNVQQFALRDTNNDGVVDFETAPDSRLRQVFSTTLSLRNRSQ